MVLPYGICRRFNGTSKSSNEQAYSSEGFAHGLGQSTICKAFCHVFSILQKFALVLGSGSTVQRAGFQHHARDGQ